MCSLSNTIMFIIEHLLVLNMDLSKTLIAIVDDDEDIQISAELFLKKYFERVLSFSQPDELFSFLEEETADVILLDLNYENGRNDGREGIEALEKIKQSGKSTEVLIMTAYAELEIAVDAVKKGAFDFIVKPWQNEKLLVSIMNAAQKKSMQMELMQKELMISSGQEPLSPIIGESPGINKIREVIIQVAKTNAPILIKGETGTGKSLVAKHIHQQSNQSNQPFIQIDFRSIPAELQLQTIFGNSIDKLGKWYLAEGGTLYLKNILAMTADVQTQLLQLLNKNQNLPKRIISTVDSNKGLDGFDQDLFFKLNIIEIDIPRLRDRHEDIIDLTEYFIEEYNVKYNKSTLPFNQKEGNLLLQYSWSGNVKELKRAVERAIIINQGNLSAVDLLPSNKHYSVLKSKPLKEIEKEHIAKVLFKNEQNIQKSASELGISRAALYRRIEKYNL